MKGDLFIEKYLTAVMTAEELNKKLNAPSVKKKFEIPERTFISPPLPKSAKTLKLATNPEFAAAFAGVGAGASAAVSAVVANNFSVSKVWIEPGCIVCDACEGIYPEVFEVTESSCIIRPGAPLNDGLKIQESAEACPVEVIKFTKVG
jgi:ferredoxin